MNKLKVLVVFGTRPEAIKMAPLCLALQADSRFEVKICLTGQHREMLQQVLDVFGITGDFDLKIMKVGQDLYDLTAKILQGMRDVFLQYRPDLCLIHGDTTTSMAAALASYYAQIKVGHVEAGLRTNDLFSPWPEEGNRRLSGVLSFMHFAPTLRATGNLLSEGVDKHAIFLTGNTVIDALHIAVGKLADNSEQSTSLQKAFSFLKEGRKLILVTGHRRENLGDGLDSVSRALATISIKYPDVDVVYAMHMNPSVRESVYKYLSDIKNVHLIDSQDYLSFVYLMKRSYLVLTDSGGIQEEAPGLGKPVLVFRDSTERPEAVESGAVKLVGLKHDYIVDELENLLTNQSEYGRMSSVVNPYGDGTASLKILQAILKKFHYE